MRAPERDRILAGAARQLVDERLDREHVVVRTHAAPERGVDARRLFAVELDAIVGNVVRHVRRRVDAVGIDAVLKAGGSQRASDSGAGDLVLPADDPTALEPRREDRVIHRTEVVVADVFFARPHDFDRAGDLLRDPRGVVHHVRFQATTEAAAEHMVVDGHLGRGQVRRLRDCGLRPRQHLSPGPRFGRSRRDVHRAVQRLHGGVREQRHLVLGRHDIAFAEDVADAADFLGDCAVALARGAQP